MAWTVTEGSHIFREWMIGPMWQGSGTGFTGLDSDTVKAALFNNTGTPDNDAALSLTGYAAATSAWVAANEQSNGEWAVGGRALASKTFTAPAADTVMFDAADITGTANVTLANVYGCLVYDDTITGGTVVDQGISYHWFGGAQQVTAGLFSVLWHANGINRYSL